MIYAMRTITVKDGSSMIDEPVVLYRGDKEIELVFGVLQQSFKFGKSENLIKTSKASHGQLIIEKLDGNSIFSNISECENGKIKFVMTEFMIDELSEVGIYNIQIRLYDDTIHSRISIPPIKNAIEVREPLTVANPAVADQGIVNLSIIDEAGEEEKIFDEEGSYIKTDWSPGDTITSAKLNKIEFSLETINNNDIQKDIDTNAKLDEITERLDTGDVNIDLSDYAKTVDIPTKTSELTNDSNFLTYIPSAYVTEYELNAKGYLTEHQDISNKADKSEIPTKTSQLTNDSNFLSSVPSEYVTDSELNAKGYLTEHQDISNKADKSEIPTKTSQLTNDSNFLTSVPSEYVTDSELNAKGYLTEHQDISNKVDKVSGKGLSTNDYTTAEKNKLAGIETGANKITVYTAKECTTFTSDDGTCTPLAVQKAVGLFPPKAHEHSQYLTEHQDISNKADKSEINKCSAFGTCDTEAATAEKVVVIDDPNWKLQIGNMITVRFSIANTASDVTLNVNNTGAYGIVTSGTSAYTGTSTTYCGNANRSLTYLFNGSHWQWISAGAYPSSATNVSLGQGYATCSTAASTKAKTASLSSYTLSTGGIVAVKFTYDVPASATLNINSKGAKNIYHKGAAIEDGVIKAGDTATFIYSTRYHLISIDRDETFSGDYNDLINAPTIPTKTSELTNDSNYVNKEYVQSELAKIDTTINLVDSVEEMTDITKQYVHSGTNTWWKYTSTTIPAGAVLSNVDNAVKWPTTSITLNKRLNSSYAEVDAPGCAIFYFTFSDEMKNILNTVDPVWIRMKGCSLYSTTGNKTSSRVAIWDSTGAPKLTLSQYSQILIYEETKTGISDTPYPSSTFDYSDGTTAPVTAIKFGYYNKTVNDNTSNEKSGDYLRCIDGKLGFNAIVNFAGKTDITEADLENVYITFNEPIVSYEEQIISEWCDTGVAYNAGDDSSVVELHLRVNEIETKIEELESNSGNTSEVTTLNLSDYWKEYIDTLDEKIITIQDECGVNALQFLWCSDIHGNPGTSPNNTVYIGEIARYIMDKYNIPFFAITGDIMSQTSHTLESAIWAEYNNLKPVLASIKPEEAFFIKGNHDCTWGAPYDVNGDGTNDYYTKNLGVKKTFRAIYQKPSLDRTKIFNEDGMSYYVDVNKYRIYMLNTHTFGDDSVDENGYAIYNGFKHNVYGTKQLQWIADTLMTVRTDQTVIFMAHAPISSMLDRDIFCEMVSAYIAKVTLNTSMDLSGAFWGRGLTDTSEYMTSQVQADFTNAKGHVGAYFNGHIHKDTIDANSYSFPIFSITTAGGDLRDSYLTDGTLSRIKETATETAMDLVTITSNCIYCTRIGSGYDRKFDRSTKEITIDYDSAYIPPLE